jgi:hypothetical protein
MPAISGILKITEELVDSRQGFVADAEVPGEMEALALFSIG